MKNVILPLILASGTLGTAFVLRSVGDGVAILYLGLALGTALSWRFFRAPVSQAILAVFWLSLLPTIWLVCRLGLAALENVPGSKNALEGYMAIGFLVFCTIYLCIFVWFTAMHLRAGIQTLRS